MKAKNLSPGQIGLLSGAIITAGLFTMLPSMVLAAVSADDVVDMKVAMKTVEVKPADISTTSLTIYPNRALVNQALAKALPAGSSIVQIKPDYQYWMMDTLQFSALVKGVQVLPVSQSWQQPLTSVDALVSAMIGKEIELARSGTHQRASGTLQAWDGEAGLLLLPDQRQELFQWREGFAMRSVEGGVLSADQLILKLNTHFSLEQPASGLGLSYFNQGLSYNNQYRVVLTPDAEKLDVHLNATIHNQSQTDYRKVSVTLAAGESGDEVGAEMFSARKGMVSAMMDTSQGIAGGERAGDLLFTPVAGQHDLLAMGSVSLFMDSERQVSYNSSYKYRFYGLSHSGNEVVNSHPLSTVRFIPKRDLPAGSIQIFEQDADQSLRMVYQGQINQTASGNQVELVMGEAYTVTVERSRLKMNQEDGKWLVDWQLKVNNRFGHPVRLRIEDAAYQLMGVSKLSGLEQDGTELYAEIPASSTHILTFTSLYSKK